MAARVSGLSAFGARGSSSKPLPASVPAPAAARNLRRVNPPMDCESMLRYSGTVAVTPCASYVSACLYHAPRLVNFLCGRSPANKNSLQGGAEGAFLLITDAEPGPGQDAAESQGGPQPHGGKPGQALADGAAA